MHRVIKTNALDNFQMSYFITGTIGTTGTTLLNQRVTREQRPNPNRNNGNTPTADTITRHATRGHAHADT